MWQKKNIILPLVLIEEAEDKMFATAIDYAYNDDLKGFQRLYDR